MPLLGSAAKASSSSSSSSTTGAAPNSTTSSGPPPLPRTARPSPSSTNAATTHAHFILQSIRTSLDHLRDSGALDEATSRQVQTTLGKAVLKESPASSNGQAASKRNDDEAETAEDRLGKRNAWMRDTLKDSSLLPALVEAALSVTAGPFLSDSQTDAIIELVERSQETIAQAVTDPKKQRIARKGAITGAIEAGKGVARGWSAASQTVSEMAAKREEAKQRSQDEKAEKREKKAIKEELKREREAFIRKRQQAILGEDGGATSDSGEDDEGDNDARRTSSSGMVQSPTAMSASRGGSMSSANLGVFATGNSASTRATPLVLGGSDSASLAMHGSAAATVACLSADSPGTRSSTATTSFSPWPGLFITSSVVAVTGDPDLVGFRGEVFDSDEEDGGEGRKRSVAPPPRRGITGAPSKGTTESKSSTTGTAQESSSSTKLNVDEAPKPRAATPSSGTTQAHARTTSGDGSSVNAPAASRQGVPSITKINTKDEDRKDDAKDSSSSSANRSSTSTIHGSQAGHSNTASSSAAKRDDKPSTATSTSTPSRTTGGSASTASKNGTSASRSSPGTSSSTSNNTTAAKTDASRRNANPSSSSHDSKPFSGGSTATLSNRSSNSSVGTAARSVASRAAGNGGGYGPDQSPPFSAYHPSRHQDSERPSQQQRQGSLSSASRNGSSHHDTSGGSAGYSHASDLNSSRGTVGIGKGVGADTTQSSSNLGGGSTTSVNRHGTGSASTNAPSSAIYGSSQSRALGIENEVAEARDVTEEKKKGWKGKLRF